VKLKPVVLREAAAQDVADALSHYVEDGFPYLIFYVERESELDVWRMLHGQRDIPAWLQR
jgi:plasmid stabilization system protein ParE